MCNVFINALIVRKSVILFLICEIEYKTNTATTVIHILQNSSRNYKTISPCNETPEITFPRRRTNQKEISLAKYKKKISNFFAFSPALFLSSFSPQRRVHRHPHTRSLSRAKLSLETFADRTWLSSPGESNHELPLPPLPRCPDKNSPLLPHPPPPPPPLFVYPISSPVIAAVHTYTLAREDSRFARACFTLGLFKVLAVKSLYARERANFIRNLYRFAAAAADNTGELVKARLLRARGGGMRKLCACI